MSAVNEKLNGAIPVLKYFKGKGRAEAIRILFEDQGIKYEDVRYSNEEFVAVKKELIESGASPFGQLPVVVLNGKTLTQSTAIARYFARIYDLYGSNHEEAFTIDMAGEAIVDVLKEAGVLFGSDDAAKLAYLQGKCHDHLTLLGNLIQKDGPFLLGEKFSYVDIYFFQVTGQIRVAFPDFEVKYPKLAALQKAVASRPKIAAYLASDRVPAK